MECAKLLAVTKLVSQASKNVSRKTRKPVWLKAFFFQNYQYNEQYIVLLLNANFNLTHNWILYGKNYDVVC